MLFGFWASACAFSHSFFYGQLSMFFLRSYDVLDLRLGVGLCTIPHYTIVVSILFSSILILPSPNPRPYAAQDCRSPPECC